MKFPDLPITPKLTDIQELIQNHPLTILSAEPGAGKSTLVPPALLSQQKLNKKILLLEPRRLAVTAVAQRIADILGEPLGQTVGYRVRNESCISGKTRIEVVTEGILTKILLSDPGLPDYDLVIFDEFHERTLAADLGLALIQDVMELRPELRVLIMSATLEIEKLKSILPLAPHIHVPGKVFPVETHYRPLPVGNFWESACARSIQLIMEQNLGDVLVFLPGTKEIRRVQNILLTLLDSGVEVLSLSGQMNLEDQRKVLRPAKEGTRRLILSTSVAETSLTVPGIKIVVDVGWQRSSRQDLRTGMDQLYTDRVSKASADQRRGRAGRTQSGLCFRLWQENETLDESFTPEIRRVDLANLVLDCALWGARKITDLRWLDTPSPHHWDMAQELLVKLEALDDNYRPSSLGIKMANLGLHPRLGHLVLKGMELNWGPLACGCAAVLEINQNSMNTSDFRQILEGLRKNRSFELEPIQKEFQRISQKMGLGSGLWKEEDELHTGVLLLLAFPDGLAKNLSPGLFQLGTGRQMKLEGSLAREALVVALDCDAGNLSGRIYLACPVSPQEVEENLGYLFTREVSLDWEGWKPKGRMITRFGSLLWSQNTISRSEIGNIAQLVKKRVQKEGINCLPWDENSQQFLNRCRWISQNKVPGNWPSWENDAIIETLNSWLGDFLQTSGEVVNPEILLQGLQSRLTYQQKSLLNQEVPEFLTVPSGSRKKIHYQEGKEPFLEVRIQELFGLKESPKICGAPLILHLLSPAQRPLQVTRDLGSFWKTTYTEVRKDMRGRYPRHYWPEDPLLAEPTSKAKPRGT